MWHEAEIIIAGVKLTSAQSMTVRVALSSFISDMYVHGLGEDQIGKEIAQGYLCNGAEVCKLIGKSIDEQNEGKANE